MTFCGELKLADWIQGRNEDSASQPMTRIVRASNAKASIKEQFYSFYITSENRSVRVSIKMAMRVTDKDYRNNCVSQLPITTPDSQGTLHSWTCKFILPPSWCSDTQFEQVCRKHWDVRKIFQLGENGRGNSLHVHSMLILHFIHSYVA